MEANGFAAKLGALDKSDTRQWAEIGKQGAQIAEANTAIALAQQAISDVRGDVVDIERAIKDEGAASQKRADKQTRAFYGAIIAFAFLTIALATFIVTVSAGGGPT